MPEHGPDLSHLTPGEKKRLSRTPEEQRAAEQRVRRPAILLATLGLALTSFGLIMTIKGKTDAAPPQMTLKTAGRPTLGNPDAPNTIVVYSDYQCPHCQDFFFDIQPELLKASGDKAKIVLLNRIIFPGSLNTAVAAECAYAQGGVQARERLSALMYAAGKSTSQKGAAWTEPEYLAGMASRSGLNRERMLRCLKDSKVVAAVKAEDQMIAEAGGNQTPGVVVNGKTVQMPTLSHILAQLP